MSLEEWQVHMEGAQQRMEGWYQLALHLAWHTAYLTRVEHNKFPSLAKHLKTFAPKKTTASKTDPMNVEPWQARRDAMRSRAKRTKQEPAGTRRKAKTD